LDTTALKEIKFAIQEDSRFRSVQNVASSVFMSPPGRKEDWPFLTDKSHISDLLLQIPEGWLDAAHVNKYILAACELMFF
jgi:hypothetical protein